MTSAPFIHIIPADPAIKVLHQAFPGCLPSVLLSFHMNEKIQVVISAHYTYRRDHRRACMCAGSDCEEAAEDQQ